MNHQPRGKYSRFRFFATLTELLPAGRRQPQDYLFQGTPTLLDAIQAQGVPHTEVALALVNGTAREPDFHLAEGMHISVYPRFLSLVPTEHLWQPPLALPPRFILDVHLGTLARELRLLGFDCYWERDQEDKAIIERGLAEQRLILTRDLGLLKHKRVRHGYFVRNTAPAGQVRELLDRFELYPYCAPLTRCTKCNGTLGHVARDAIWELLPEKTRAQYQLYYRCTHCGQIYWHGTHLDGLATRLTRYLGGRKLRLGHEPRGNDRL